MLDDLIDLFLLERAASGCSARTVGWHRDSIRIFACWLCDHGHAQDPQTWTPTLLRRYIVNLQKRPSRTGKPLAGTTVTSYVQSLLAFTRWLHDEEYTATNVGAKVKKPRAPQVEKHPLSAEELHVLLRAAKTTRQGRRDYAILCVLIDCGLRASELTNLTVDDVSLSQQLLFVQRGKGNKARAVPFSYPTGRAIRHYLLKERRQDAASPILFLSEYGGQLKARSLLSLLKRIARSAEVRHVYPHLLRHTFSLHFLRNGGDSLTLQRLLGHTSLEMTNRYVHMVTDDLVQAHQQSSPLARLGKIEDKSSRSGGT